MGGLVRGRVSVVLRLFFLIFYGSKMHFRSSVWANDRALHLARARARACVRGAETRRCSQERERGMEGGERERERGGERGRAL